MQSDSSRGNLIRFRQEESLLDVMLTIRVIPSHTTQLCRSWTEKIETVVRQGVTCTGVAAVICNLELEACFVNI